jgi:hypothetical protein
MLSINLLDNSDFYSGAFAAEYGNALSGIMDMKLRKGNQEKSEKSFQLSFWVLMPQLRDPLRKEKKHPTWSIIAIQQPVFWLV